MRKSSKVRIFMSAKLIIKKLNKAINEKKSQDVINELTSILVETITEAAQEPLFYSLPFEHISKIVTKVEFGNEKEVSEPLLLLQTLIQKTSEFHGNKAISLLNKIKIEQLPPLSMDDIICLVSKFTKSELLVKLGELYEYDKSLLRVDYSQENSELKRKIAKLEKKLESVQKKTKETKGKVPKFSPVTEKPKDYEADVFDACEKGKLDNVQYHFEVGRLNKNSSCDRVLSDGGYYVGATALHVAASYGHLPIVEYLCEVQKFNVEAKTENGVTPLFLSCISGHLDIVRYLCEVQKANPEAQNKNGFVPLHYACMCSSSSREGNVPVVRYLCEVQKVNTSIKGRFEKTPYQSAKIRNNTAIVEYLESIGVNE